MGLPVVVRPLLSGGFVACSGDPLRCEAHGETRDEALHKLRELINAERKRGVEIVDFDFSLEHPLKRFAGLLKDDPLLDEWHQAMAEYRDSVEAADSWAAVDSLRDGLDAVYGEQPDSTPLIREDRYQ